MPVVSRNQSLRSRVLAGVDKAFAEPVRLSFLRDGSVDPDRSIIEIEAVLRVGGGEAANMSGGVAQDWRSRIAVEKAELHINAGTYAGPPIATRDRVRALSRPGQPWFEVLRIDDRGENRLVLELGKA